MGKLEVLCDMIVLAVSYLLLICDISCENVHWPT